MNLEKASLKPSGPARRGNLHTKARCVHAHENASSTITCCEVFSSAVKDRDRGMPQHSLHSAVRFREIVGMPVSDAIFDADSGRSDR